MQEKHDDVRVADAEVLEAGGDSACGEVEFGMAEGFAGGGVD